MSTRPTGQPQSRMEDYDTEASFPQPTETDTGAPWHDADLLAELYVERDLSTREIATGIFDGEISHERIRQLCHRHDLIEDDTSSLAARLEAHGREQHDDSESTHEKYTLRGQGKTPTPQTPSVDTDDSLAGRDAYNGRPSRAQQRASTMELLETAAPEPLAVETVATRLGVGSKTAYNYLNQLEADGEIEHVGGTRENRRYRLVASGPNATLDSFGGQR